MSGFPVPVVTCTIYNGNTFLVIRRRQGAKKFGGLWAFPGGKVEHGETVIGALRREVEEETGLQLTDDFLLIDSYYYENSLGLHFALFTAQNNVRCMDGYEYKWLKNLAELQQLERIPGIDYHIVRAAELFAQKAPKQSLEATDYTPDKYINT